MMRYLIIFVLTILIAQACHDNHPGENTIQNYYFDAVNGDDTNNGTSDRTPWRSLSRLEALQLQPGDSVLLAAGQTFTEPLILKDQHGSEVKPIVVTTYDPAKTGNLARILVSGPLNGLLLENCGFVDITSLDISAQAGQVETGSPEAMRCGVLVIVSQPGQYDNLLLKNLQIHDIFYEPKGYTRPAAEVRSANGTQRYGWGIRVINTTEGAYMTNITIDSCVIRNVAHTGIKITGHHLNERFGISQLEIANNQVLQTGGPGIQMSRVAEGHVHHNLVNESGSSDDSRKWGRGSGLWTWGSSNVLIEHNRFTNANGPGDSAGAHIDFNCKNVVLQYNYSSNNAGGFCEILGNNYNCAYRYNISVNDGYRVKGQNGAFQEGKIFWLSGYVGQNSERQGPFNSYFYNNTIIVDKEIEAKLAIDRVANGILIANNIFYIMGEAKMVKGDQYNPESEGDWLVSNYAFTNNLFLHKQSWPVDSRLQDGSPLFGDPQFAGMENNELVGLTPTNIDLVRNRGVNIEKLDKDTVGLVYGLKMEFDILGNPIVGLPDLGAIELQ